MKKNFKKENFWKVLTFGLGTILAISFLFDISFSISPKWRSSVQDSQIKGQSQLSNVKPSEIYKDLVCACCGKSIADCTCGMAKERKAFVDDQTAKGLDKRGIFKEAIKQYGEDILFDKTLAAEIKEELIAEAPEDRAIIVVEPESIDLGEISMAQGNVEAIFKVKNVGKSDLLISGMETSCGCTTAILKINGQESPVFGMSDNPIDWSATLSPEQEGELMAIFDPGHHGPEGTGPATRTISIKSSDPIDSFKKVQFEVDVVK